MLGQINANTHLLIWFWLPQTGILCTCPSTHVGDGIECDPVTVETTTLELHTGCENCHTSAKCIQNGTNGKKIIDCLVKEVYPVTSDVTSISMKWLFISGQLCICVNGTVGNGTWCDIDSSVKEDVSKSRRVGYVDLSENNHLLFTQWYREHFLLILKNKDWPLIFPDILIGAFFLQILSEENRNIIISCMAVTGGIIFVLSLLVLYHKRNSVSDKYTVSCGDLHAAIKCNNLF